MKRENERILIRRIQRESDRESANKLIGIYYLEIYAFIFKQVGEKELAKQANTTADGQTDNCFPLLIYSHFTSNG